MWESGMLDSGFTGKGTACGEHRTDWVSCLDAPCNEAKLDGPLDGHRCRSPRRGVQREVGFGRSPIPLAGKAVPADLSVKVTDAPTTGALSGTVVDEGGTPIANATVILGSASGTTDGGGAFHLTPGPGRALLTVSAPRRVSFLRPFGITSSSPGMRVRLVPLGAPQDVGAKGETVTAGVVTLELAVGVYPSGARRGVRSQQLGSTAPISQRPAGA